MKAVFPLRTSSILLRSFLHVSMILLILPFQSGSLVVFPLLSFSIPILSIVTYAAAYRNEFSSVMLCVWLLDLWWFYWVFQLLLSTLLCRMTLCRMTSVIVLLLSNLTVAESFEFWIDLFLWLFSWGTTGFFFSWLSCYQHFGVLLAHKVLLRCGVSVVLGSVVSNCWCSLFTLLLSYLLLFHGLQPLLFLNLAYLICKPLLTDLC